MEHRQPPLRPTAEQAEDDETIPLGSRRFSRFVPSQSVRRVALPRVVLAALAVSGAVITLGVIGTYAARTLPEFLHRQPVYRFRFDDIVLDPPPPTWYRGGSPAFLARLRDAKHQPDEQSVLDLDLEQLAGVFRLDPWVAKVTRVERAYPHRVVVHLVYRQPVARVPLSISRYIVLDAEGVVLSEKEIDPHFRNALIQVIGVEVPPGRARPGEVWKRAAGPGGEAEVDELVVRAAALAGYLASVQHELEHGPGERLVFKVITNANKPDELWVVYGHRQFCWGMAPGFETPDSIKAAAKWEMLRDWLLASPPPEGRTPPQIENYWIKPTGIEFLPTKRTAD